MPETKRFSLQLTKANDGNVFKLQDQFIPQQSGRVAEEGRNVKIPQNPGSRGKPFSAQNIPSGGIEDIVNLGFFLGLDVKGAQEGFM